MRVDSRSCCSTNVWRKIYCFKVLAGQKIIKTKLAQMCTPVDFQLLVQISSFSIMNSNVLRQKLLEHLNKKLFLCQKLLLMLVFFYHKHMNSICKTLGIYELKEDLLTLLMWDLSLSAMLKDFFPFSKWKGKCFQSTPKLTS
jgi:hypothetical protein